MRDFIVKTNFGHTYQWSAKQIAHDYAYTAIQGYSKDEVLKTYEELYETIVNDEDFLTHWFNDYIRGDLEYAAAQAELISVDEKEYKAFVDWAINVHGVEV